MSDKQVVREIFDDAHKRAPQLTACMLAQRLGISEGALQAARLESGITGLALTACDLVMQFSALGPLSVATHTPHASMTSGAVLFDAHGQHQQLASTRMQWLLPHWYWACLVATDNAITPAWPYVRLDIFDRYGLRLHSLMPNADAKHEHAWQRLNEFRCSTAPRFIERIATCPDTTTVPYGLQREWLRLSTPETLTPLLKQHGCTRLQAYRAVEGHFTQRLLPHTLVQTVAQSEKTPYSLKLALHRPGALHIQTGHYCAPELINERWHTRCHHAEFEIDTSAIAETWWAMFPGQDQNVLSIDAFDHQGALIARLTDAA